MNIVEKILTVVTILITLNYLQLIYPIFSWEGINDEVREYRIYYPARLMAITHRFHAIYDFLYVATNYLVLYNFFQTVYLFSSAMGAESKLLIFAAALSGVNTFIGFWYYSDSLEFGVSDGPLDDIVLNFLAHISYKKIMPREIYPLFKLYHFKYLSVFHKYKTNSLARAAYDFSTVMSVLISDSTYEKDVYKFLLEPKNVSVLATISNVLTDNVKLAFIDSTSGDSSRKVYIASLIEMSKEMEEIVSIKKITDRDEKNKNETSKADKLNEELIAEMTKSKQNKHYIV